jgi:hypothetical protein
LGNVLLIDHIFPFVGSDQFRFVAGVNRTFRTVYSKVSPAKTTTITLNNIDCVKCYMRDLIYDDSMDILSGLNRLTMKPSILQEPLIISLSVEHGDIEVVRLFNQISSSRLEETKVAAEAALQGNLKSLKKLRSKGCDWDGYTCSNAALNGHLHVLSYAHANGCYWNGYTCSNAAKNGHLEVLQYTREHGCPWTLHTSKEAYKNGHSNIVSWIHANGCPEWPAMTLMRRLKNDGVIDDVIAKLRGDRNSNNI